MRPLRSVVTWPVAYCCAACQAVVVKQRGEVPDPPPPYVICKAPMCAGLALIARPLTTATAKERL